MSRYLVDTDWLIDVLHGQEHATRTLVHLAPAGLAVSYITYAELYEGAYYARQADRHVAALDALLDSKMLIPLSLEIMRRFAILRGSLARPIRQQLGDMDLLIAATALEHDLTVVTRNVRDFTLVPELALFAGH
jgi:tRNA(fMet)-specific endonuclease VapC